jgi:hypothetical protein
MHRLIHSHINLFTIREFKKANKDGPFVHLLMSVMGVIFRQVNANGG